MPEISCEKLRALFLYEPETGVLTRKTSPTNSAKAGEEAGYLRPDGYRCVEIGNTPYKTHRLIWCLVTGAWPGKEVDHINHVKDDNQWINLREVTHAENGRNHTQHKNNTSGVTGVGWHKALRKWEAHIGVKGKKISLGYFSDKEDATIVRRAAETKYEFHSNHGQRRE